MAWISYNIHANEDEICVCLHTEANGKSLSLAKLGEIISSGVYQETFLLRMLANVCQVVL